MQIFSPLFVLAVAELSVLFTGQTNSSISPKIRKKQNRLKIAVRAAWHSAKVIAREVVTASAGVKSSQELLPDTHEAERSKKNTGEAFPRGRRVV